MIAHIYSMFKIEKKLQKMIEHKAAKSRVGSCKGVITKSSNTGICHNVNISVNTW